MPGPTYCRMHGSFREKYRISSFSLGRCCCCVLSVLFIVATIIGIIALVVFLVIKPKKPEFELQSVAVEALRVEPPPGSVSAVASMEVFLSLNIAMVFAASNPNNVGIKYSPSKFYVMYKGMPIGVAVVPAFYQPSHSHTTVETRLLVNRVNILQAAALDLFRDATVNDRVALRLTGDVGARIRVIQITLPQVQVSLDCQIVLSPHRRALTDKQCGVDGVNF